MGAIPRQISLFLSLLLPSARPDQMTELHVVFRFSLFCFALILTVVDKDRSCSFLLSKSNAAI